MIADIGGPLHYLDHAGPAGQPRIVYVHGIGGTSLNWADLAALMSAHMRGVAVDLPGFGRSPAADRRTTIGANAAAVTRFLPTIDEPGRRVILVGTSMGALIAILTAASTPDLIAALVLIDPPVAVAQPLHAPRDVRRSALLGGMPGLGEYLLHRHRQTVPAEVRVAQMLQRCCHRPEQVSPAMLAALIADEQRVDHAGARRAGDYLWAARSIALTLLLRRRWLWARMARLPMPVLLMHGVHDSLIPIAAAHAAARRFPHWDLCELDAGHIPHIEAPDQVAAALVPWIVAIVDERRPLALGTASTAGTSSDTQPRMSVRWPLV